MYSLLSRCTSKRFDSIRDKKVHTDPDRVRRDIAGEYVLLSDDFIYDSSTKTRIDKLTESLEKDNMNQEIIGFKKASSIYFRIDSNDNNK